MAEDFYDKAVKMGLMTQAEADAARAAANKPTTTTTTAAPKPTSTSYPTVSSDTDATALINKIFQNELKRDATAAELKYWKPLLKAAQKAGGATQSYKVKDKTGIQTTVSGLNEEVWLANQLATDTKYKKTLPDVDYAAELATIKTTDPKLFALKQDKAIYDAAIAAANGDPVKIAAANANTSYGRDLSDLKAAIASNVKAAGATNTDEEITALANDLISKGNTLNSPTGSTQFQNFLKFTNATTGKAASNLDVLSQAALDNGIELSAVFVGDALNSALKAINAGESAQSYIKKIRDAAGKDKPKYVQDQLKAGKDLREIYSSYIKQMADAFNIDAAAIDLNDPLLKQAITNNGLVKTNDFSNLIRKDTRYQGTTGATGENQYTQAIKDIGVQSGIALTDADVAAIKEEAVSKGLNVNSPEISALIRNKITYTPGKKLTGTLGNAFEELRQTALANGIDLDKTFGSNVQEWLQKINQGESIDTFKRTIREVAKMGLPDNVKKLLDQGVDLSSVYGPYKNTMASVLEIDPNSIDINDPLLRTAIGPDKEVSIYDWQRALRKDSRWQYTNQARSEVSNAAQKVLQDFGFMG